MGADWGYARDSSNGNSCGVFNEDTGVDEVKYISLFAGIGGFDLALNRLGHTCVWANEWNKYAAEIYNKNFKEAQSQRDAGSWSDSANVDRKPRTYRRGESTVGVDTRDITTVPTSEIPDHDLLVGGFPCQAFSIAGKRRGFDDTRGTLFFEIARILKDKQPKLFILENVKGLLSHDNGNTFKTIISTLTELGYDLQWQVLNSKNFGVPQNRERVFIVGHLRGEPRPEVFPITAGSGQTDELQGLQVGAITARRGTAKSDGDYVVESIRQTQKNPQGMRVYGTDGIPTTIASQAGGLSAKTGLYKVDRKTGDIKDGTYSNTLQAKDGQSHSLETFVGRSDMAIRRLTPTECERLQGFPDGWTEGISDTQRYKCLGNAVTVNVVYEIARRL